jgi:hypothetical protein
VAMMTLGPEPGAFGKISGFDIFLGAVGCVLVVLFVGHTVGVARRLAKIDPASGRQAASHPVP